VLAQTASNGMEQKVGKLPFNAVMVADMRRTVQRTRHLPQHDPGEPPPIRPEATGG
jgi:hypothetical protein